VSGKTLMGGIENPLRPQRRAARRGRRPVPRRAADRRQRDVDRRPAAARGVPVQDEVRRARRAGQRLEGRGRPAVRHAGRHGRDLQSRPRARRRGRPQGRVRRRAAALQRPARIPQPPRTCPASECSILLQARWDRSGPRRKLPSLPNSPPRDRKRLPNQPLRSAQPAAAASQPATIAPPEGTSTPPTAPGASPAIAPVEQPAAQGGERTTALSPPPAAPAPPPVGAAPSKKLLKLLVDGGFAASQAEAAAALAKLPPEMVEAVRAQFEGKPAPAPSPAVKKGGATYKQVEVEGPFVHPDMEAGGPRLLAEMRAAPEYAEHRQVRAGRVEADRPAERCLRLRDAGRQDRPRRPG
jgi:hypothetical protein